MLLRDSVSPHRVRRSVGSVDRGARLVLVLGHQVRVGPQGEAGVVVAQVLSHGADRHASLEQHAGVVVTERMEAVAKDLADPRRIFVAAVIGDDASFALARDRAVNLGYFMRSLVGLDRAAGKDAFLWPRSHLTDERPSVDRNDLMLTFAIDNRRFSDVSDP